MVVAGVDVVGMSVVGDIDGSKEVDVNVLVFDIDVVDDADSLYEVVDEIVVGYIVDPELVWTKTVCCWILLEYNDKRKQP